ncbi:Hypothetical_protein [Hexamita inflata]|uniref:Hypothetical_protein n=1 Tax=Hexamita inflata TaxID=28002 RepID=A0AA86UZQ2_9EUKA|nr:Hypothetical protein HINF_LOCUS62474 [Hexamita inflata]
MEQYFNLQLQLIQFQLANEKQQNILLQEQLSNEKALNQELINELETKCNQLEQLLQLYEATMPQNNQIQQANAGLQTSFQNCSQNNQSISINTSYTQIYTQQQNRISEYEKYIVQLLASNEKIKSQYDDLNSKILDKLQEIDKINSKDKEKALENPLYIDPELLNCKNRDIQRLQQQYENVNRKYICAQDEYELMKERNNLSQGYVKQLEAEIARLNEKLKLKENTCERLQSESKCPMMKTIQELQAQNQQYVNHIHNIEAQYSEQDQLNKLQIINLNKEIKQQININETLTLINNKSMLKDQQIQQTLIEQLFQQVCGRRLIELRGLFYVINFVETKQCQACQYFHFANNQQNSRKRLQPFNRQITIFVFNIYQNILFVFQITLFIFYKCVCTLLCHFIHQYAFYNTLYTNDILCTNTHICYYIICSRHITHLLLYIHDSVYMLLLLVLQLGLLLVGYNLQFFVVQLQFHILLDLFSFNQLCFQHNPLFQFLYILDAIISSKKTHQLILLTQNQLLMVMQKVENFNHDIYKIKICEITLLNVRICKFSWYSQRTT